jgi:streptogramin lyase
MMRLPVMKFGATVALLAMTACAAGSSDAVPGRLGYAQLKNTYRGPGRTKLFPDTFGDATPDGIVTGPDDALWFTDTGNDVIGRITTRGKYTLQMPAGAELSDGITVGPDGNLWFTLEQSYGGIGRITPAGVVTLFADPGGSFPQGITSGPDNALWFAESNGTVGRMTLDGKVKHFTVAASNAGLEGIVTGPDGNLWVTHFLTQGSRFSDAVIRLTPKGKFTTFQIGSSSSPVGPDEICVGPDDALWFTEQAANAIGRITIKGSYTAYPTNYEYVDPSGIAAGPDGNLWFTDFSGRGVIGRLKLTGHFKFFKVPGSFPELAEITRGPDGSMWFTSYMEPSAVGRITTF